MPHRVVLASGQFIRIGNPAVAPDRILLDTAQPTQQWELRDSGTKRTLLVMQCILAA